MHSLRAARWLGQKSGPIFRSLWTKVHQITFAYRCGSFRSLQHRFPIDNVLLHSGDICDQVAKLSEIMPKFDVFGPSNLGGWPPKFLTKFYKCGSLLNMWQSLVMIGQATSEIRW